ncbi:MAG: nucleotide exchange factor GrpE [Pyrinomonadaceae bacterium]
MNDYQENLDTLDTVVDLFDTDNLPSLEDLMRELENEDEFGFEKVQTPDSVPIVALGNNTATDSTLETELKQAYQRLFESEQEKHELISTVELVNENFKKYRWRAERERTDHYTFAVVSIIREFLPILDNLNRALQTVPIFTEVQKVTPENNLEASNFSNFVGGIELIYQQTMKYLTDLGVEEITSVGEMFDPNIHEAVATEPKADVPPNTITEEVLRGYRLGDKLIRAAMVKVSTNG